MHWSYKGLQKITSWCYQSYSGIIVKQIKQCEGIRTNLQLKFQNSKFTFELYNCIILYLQLYKKCLVSNGIWWNNIVQILYKNHSVHCSLDCFSCLQFYSSFYKIINSRLKWSGDFFEIRRFSFYCRGAKTPTSRWASGTCPVWCPCGHFSSKQTKSKQQCLNLMKFSWVGLQVVVGLKKWELVLSGTRQVPAGGGKICPEPDLVRVRRRCHPRVKTQPRTQPRIAIPITRHFVLLLHQRRTPASHVSLQKCWVVFPSSFDHSQYFFITMISLSINWLCRCPATSVSTLWTDFI
jgi:hypothetical protein